jgi:pantothenate kinase-related protein Tda10
MISSTSMQTSIPRPHILFIEGLPGSGKSTVAEAVEWKRTPTARRENPAHCDHFDRFVQCAPLCEFSYKV